MDCLRSEAGDESRRRVGRKEEEEEEERWSREWPSNRGIISSMEK